MNSAFASASASLVTEGFDITKDKSQFCSCFIRSAQRRGSWFLTSQWYILLPTDIENENTAPKLLENLDWNVFLNFNSVSLHVRIENDIIDHEYFSTNSDSDSENGVPFNIDKSTSLSSKFTRYSMSIPTSCVSTMSSIDSFLAEGCLSCCDPSCVPRFIAKDEKAELFVNAGTSFFGTRFPYFSKFILNFWDSYGLSHTNNSFGQEPSWWWNIICFADKLLVIGQNRSY